MLLLRASMVFCLLLHQPMTASSTLRGGAETEGKDVLQQQSNDNQHFQPEIDDPDGAMVWDETDIDLLEYFNDRELFDDEMETDEESFTSSSWQYSEVEEPDFTRQERRELIQNVRCPGGGPLDYFELKINFISQGGADTSQCTSSRKKRLGNDVNSLLREYGLGNKGNGDDAVHLSKVCNKPKTTTENNRRKLGVRHVHYLYKGGGTCRSCPENDSDARRLVSQWFKDTYAPELQNLLRNRITVEVAPNHKKCLGQGPQVLVNVIPKNSRISSNC